MPTISLIEVKEIFSFVQKGLTETGEVIGEFKLHLKEPKVYLKMQSRGIKELDYLFNKKNK